jgi:hypothetical protein
MSARGVIRFWKRVDAVFDGKTWTCKNKFLEILLNLGFGKHRDVSPNQGYRAAYLVEQAAKFFRAKIIEFPIDDYEYPPDAIF